MKKFLVAVAFLVGCQARVSESDNQSQPLDAAGLLSSSMVTISDVQSFVDRILKSQSDQSYFYSFEGFCLDISSRWIPEFEEAKIPAFLQQTVAVHQFTVDSKKIQRSPTHFFLAINPQTADEIIVDATYGQFIDGAKQLVLPKVLVSKTSDLKKFFAQYASRIKVEVAYDSAQGRFNPDEFVEVIYSHGNSSKYRTSFPSAR